MIQRKFIVLILILSAAALSACGGGGGAATNAAATVTMTPSKTLALANGSDTVTIQAEVKKTDGTVVSDGTQVSFSVPAATGTLSAASATTTNGIATVTLTRTAVTGANKNETVVVTAVSGSASDNKGVKFINQPSSADVFIALNQAVTNLGSLDLTINNTAGASFDNAAQSIAAVNAAFGNTLVLGNFSADVNSTRILLINGTGFNTGTAPIIKATFAVASDAGLPQFGSSSTASITATDSGSNPITPAVSATDMTVTVTYDTEN